MGKRGRLLGHGASQVILILQAIATVCLVGGALLLVYKLMTDKRFFHNDSSGGGQKMWKK